jgi:hypothetical protein
MNGKKTISVVLAGLLMGAATPSLLAEASSSNVQQSNGELIESLVAMSGDERRAYLKALPPEQRRVLWMQTKREQAARRGVQPKARGTGLTAQPRTPQGQVWADAKGTTPEAQKQSRAVGTITYDSGAFSTTFGGGGIIGNRFDTHTGIPVFASGSVETVQAVVVQGTNFTTSSAGFVLLGPQTGGGGASAIFSTFTGATGVTDTVTFAGIGANYTGNEFFVLFGDFASSYVPVFGTGTTLGQGHHGVVGYTGGMGPNITNVASIPGQNAFIRTSGNLVPVELMSFDIE